jgi:hypothetical protein
MDAVNKLISGNAQNDVANILLARLAGILTHPVKYFHESHLEQMEISCKTMKKLVGRNVFKRPVEEQIFKELELDKFDLPEELMDQLSENSQARLSTMITVAQPEQLHQAACILAAAIMHKYLCALVAKNDRQEAIAQLGKQAFQIGVREAGLLYGDLAKLQDEQPLENRDLRNRNTAERTNSAIALGYAWLYCFVKSSQASLAELFSYRLVRGFHPPDGSRLDAKCKMQIARLLTRKIDGWAICIV